MGFKTDGNPDTQLNVAADVWPKEQHTTGSPGLPRSPIKMTQTLQEKAPLSPSRLMRQSTSTLKIREKLGS